MAGSGPRYRPELPIEKPPIEGVGLQGGRSEAGQLGIFTVMAGRHSAWLYQGASTVALVVAGPGYACLPRA